MASLITKTTGIDNFNSEIKNHIEVWIRNKKAYIELGRLTIINNDNIKNLERYRAFKIAFNIAKNYYNFPFSKYKHY